MMPPNSAILLATTVDDLFNDVEDVEETFPEEEVFELPDELPPEEAPEFEETVEIPIHIPEQDLAPKVFEEEVQVDPRKGKNRKKQMFDDSLPPITTLTILARALRNEGFKLSMFNVKDTLVRYLDMYGERKVARHVIDHDASAFYEIHALYIAGSTIFQFLTSLGFVPMHPTDIDENFSRDMPYEVAMKNDSLFINVMGGLQQHSPMEETIIRNLYEWEKKRFSVYTTTSSDNQIENTKNLMLAAMQSFSAQQPELAQEFFKLAMRSDGVDPFIDMMAATVFND